MNRTLCLTLLAVGLWAPGVQAAPLSVADLVSRAASCSPEVHAAEAALAVSRAQAQQAGAAFLPQVSVSGNVLKLDGSPVAVFGMPSAAPGGSAGIGGGAGMATLKPGDAMVLGSATVTQPLFAGFRNLGAFREAHLGMEAACLDLERARRKAGLEALEALLQLSVRQAEVQTVEAQRRQAMGRFSLVEAQLGAGSASELERLQARALVSRVDAQSEEARRAEELARQELVLRLGGEVPEAPWVSHVSLAFESPGAAFERALAERLDLRAATLREAAADARVQAARAGYWPVINAFGTVSQLGSDSANRGTMVGAQLAWSPFDGLKTPAGVALAEAQRARQAADRAALQRAIHRQVREAWNMHEDAASRLAVRNGALAVAQEAQRVALRLKLAGRLNLAGATDAETTLAQAQEELRSAELSRAIAAIKLAEALGLSCESLVGKEI